MSDEFDVSSGEMHDDELTEAAVASLIEGTELDPELDDLAGFVDELRCFSAAVDQPVATGALAEFVGVDLVTEKGDLPVMAASNATGPATQASGLPKSRSKTWRSRMFTQVTTFAGTLVGKMAIGTTVALASVGGAHAVDVIDVPLLPDVEEPVLEEFDNAEASFDDVESDDTEVEEEADVDGADDAADDVDGVEDAVDLDDVDGVEDEVDVAEVDEDEVDEDEVEEQGPDLTVLLAELEAEYASEVADINAGYDAEIRELRLERAGIEADMAEDLAGVEDDAEDTVGDLDAELAEMQLERTGIIADRDADLAEIGLDYAADLRELRRELEDATGGDRREIEREIAAVEAERESEAAGAAADYNADLAELDAAIQALEDQRDDLLNGSGPDEAEIRGEYGADLAEVDQEIAAVESERAEALAAALVDFDEARAELGS